MGNAGSGGSAGVPSWRETRSSIWVAVTFSSGYTMHAILVAHGAVLGNDEQPLGIDKGSFAKKRKKLPIRLENEVNNQMYQLALRVLALNLFVFENSRLRTTRNAR